MCPCRTGLAAPFLLVLITFSQKTFQKGCEALSETLFCLCPFKFYLKHLTKKMMSTCCFNCRTKHIDVVKKVCPHPSVGEPTGLKSIQRVGPEMCYIPTFPYPPTSRNPGHRVLWKTPASVYRVGGTCAVSESLSEPVQEPRAANRRGDPPTQIHYT